MIKKLQDNLAAVAALIGVVGAIGAGFITYGEMQEKINSLSQIDLKPVEKQLEKQDKKIAVLEKTIQILEVEIKELKVSNKNPLAN